MSELNKPKAAAVKKATEQPQKEEKVIPMPATAPDEQKTGVAPAEEKAKEK